MRKDLDPIFVKETIEEGISRRYAAFYLAQKVSSNPECYLPLEREAKQYHQTMMDLTEKLGIKLKSKSSIWNDAVDQVRGM